MSWSHLRWFELRALEVEGQDDTELRDLQVMQS